LIFSLFPSSFFFFLFAIHFDSVLVGLFFSRFIFSFYFSSTVGLSDHLLSTHFSSICLPRWSSRLFPPNSSVSDSCVFHSIGIE
jgi:hypothetical protein